MHVGFRRHDKIAIDGIEYFVEARTSTGFLLIGQIDRFPKPITTEELLCAFESGRLEYERGGSKNNAPRPQFSALPFSFRKSALARARLLKEISTNLGPPPHSTASLQEGLPEFCRASRHPLISVSTARRLLAIDRTRGRALRRLAPKYTFGPQGGKLSDLVEAEISRGINDMILCRAPKKINETWDTICDRILKNKEIPPETGLPSLSTVYRRVKALSENLVMERQFGRNRARQKFRLVSKGPSELGPYSVIEIDHTPINCHATTADGLVLGRPWLIAAVDRYSRMCVGFILTFEPPSAMSILLLIRSIILGKDRIIEKYDGINSSWPCRGFPFMIVCDNGYEFHGCDLTEALQEIGIGIEYCATKSPGQKGRIERFFLTIQYSLLQNLPGVTLGKFDKDAERDPAMDAILTIEELSWFILKFVVDVYHQRAHAGLGKRTPLEAWNEAIDGYEIDVSVSALEIELACLCRERRTIQREGISLHGFFYQAPILEALRIAGRAKDKFDIRYNPLDLGKLLICDPATGQFHDVPAVSPDAAGMNKWQREAILAEKNRHAAGTNAVVRKAKAEIRDRAEALLSRGHPAKGIGSRRKALRLLSKPAGPDSLVQTVLGQDELDRTLPHANTHTPPTHTRQSPAFTPQDLDELATQSGVRSRRRPR